MRLLEYFHDFHIQIGHNPFHIKGTWTPPQHRDTALDAFICAVEREIPNLTQYVPPLNNYADPLTLSSKDLKAADKGSGTVIIDRDWNINECLRQLNDTKFYRRLDTDIS